MANYATITRDLNPRAATGGYKNVFLFAPRADFLALQQPTGAGTTIGDTLSIATAHTFTSPAGFFSWDCKTDSVTLKGSTVGDDGARELEYSAEFVILGDSASTQEQLSRALNDDIICLIKEAACLVDDSYIQLGDECISPKFNVEFDGKTTKEGKKEYKVTVVCKAKFFYNATVTMAS
ncbi:MAG: hypothetical protein ACTHKV_03745 [Flavipsychrobacter sp.]